VDERRPSTASTRPARYSARLRGSFLVGTQYCIHPGLPARALGAEPSEHFGVYAQGDRFLRRLRLQPLSHDAPNDVRRVGLRMRPSGLDLPVLQGADPWPISSRCFQSRFPAHAWSPFALRSRGCGRHLPCGQSTRRSREEVQSNPCFLRLAGRLASSQVITGRVCIHLEYSSSGRCWRPRERPEKQTTAIQRGAGGLHADVRPRPGALFRCRARHRDRRAGRLAGRGPTSSR
jgi:hypothetical protein